MATIRSKYSSREFVKSLIWVELNSGETEILMISLQDKNIHPYQMFRELYHLRWPIEEATASGFSCKFFDS